jgi:hydroxymethylpyrimidine pyrophosphatase-like HAD family hydrolase|tara:strand:- start:2236 stop:2631 length:396 start_codon:yes stop_codon:yes gene_type:complete
MDELKRVGIEYISNREIALDDAVMFDIDDTLIYVNKDPITPMIELLHEAKQMGYTIVIITARPDWDEFVRMTIDELKSYNIYYDYLGFTSASTKTLMKKKLPYNFILSVGDLETDLTDSMHTLNTSSLSHN